MNDNMNILGSKEMRQRPFAVPDGYFDKLEAKLEGIPTARVSMWGKVRPVMAMAASFAAILLVGGLILKKASSPVGELSLYEQYAYADLIPVSEPFAFFESQQEETVSEEDIIDYLIESNSDLNGLQ